VFQSVYTPFFLTWRRSQSLFSSDL